MRAFVHDRDTVGHADRLFLVMGHEHEGNAELAVNVLELDLHLLAQPVIESA